jgi:hypothetical protein
MPQAHSETLIIVVAMLLMLGVVLGFAAFGLKFVFEYRVTERGLYILLGRVSPIRVLPIRKIVAVQRRPFDRQFWRWGMFTNWRLGNRLCGEIVWVKTRGLPMTGIVVTPRDPDAFERDLAHVIEQYHHQE